MGVFTKWLMIGLLPQMTTWIVVTILLGALFGSIPGWVALRRAAPAARPRWPSGSGRPEGEHRRAHGELDPEDAARSGAAARRRARPPSRP